MARRRRLPTSPISIGNCTVDIDGDNISCETPSRESLLISVSDAAKIRISAVTDSRKYMTRRSHRNLLSTLRSQDNGKESNPLEAHSFLLLNPKDIDSSSKLLLQKVLNVYTKELPSMNYAANTGKKSLFLERCVMSGKYKTLVLALNSFKGFEEVIAAVTYQIIPSDTQYAEIPLTAVSSIYQNVGFGHLLYGELMKRLRNVGILTIFCWADKESEGFWLKQGFLSIADVDAKGRVHRLPIRADIRRALCFPGGSTLMVAHLKKDIPATASPAEHVRSCVSLKSHAKTHIHSMTPGVDDSGQAHVASKIDSEKDIPAAASPAEYVRSCSSLKSHANTHIHARTPGVDDSGQAHVGSKSDSENGKKLDGSSPSHIRSQGFTDSVSLKGAGCNDMTIDLGFANDGHDVDLKRCCCSGRSIKKRVWEASMSSLKSKRVKAGHHNDCHLDSECNFSCNHDRGNSDTIDDCSLDASRCKSLTTKDSLRLSLVVHSEENRAVCGTTEDNVSTGLASKGGHSTIMFMNIADQAKKTWLTKIVEELGGSVTSEGNACTHVITGKARKTLNFCVALCSGAWIVSSNWLKSSFKAGKFLDESQFILEDKDYVLKYKFDLRDAVSKAKANPHALLEGYQVFLAKHIEPSVEILSAIIVAAGGDVVRRLDNMKEPSKTIFLACEEDMEEAMVAAKKGVWTYCSDWFMSCVMRQELDFEAPQFAESL